MANGGDVMEAETIARELLSKGEVQVTNYLTYRKGTGGEFNLFRIVRRHVDEEHGHSAFIAELLSPEGSHGQGSVFLDLFLDVLDVQGLVKGISSWQVELEVGREVGGRIDILLTGNGNSGSRFGIAIENKIYAGDQKEQLSRYWEYLTNKYCRVKKEENSATFLLYYLTLDGNAPSEQSVRKIPKDELAYCSGADNEAPLRVISYDYHIVEWLNLCKQKATSLPYVREGISQYLDLINDLTGNGVRMKDLLNNLLNTPEKLFVASKFANSIKDFKKQTVCDIWDAVLAEWPKRARSENSTLLGTLVSNEELGMTHDLSKALKDKSNQRFSKKSSVPRFFGVAAREYFFKGIPVGIEVRFDNCFYVGLYGVEEGQVLDIEVVQAFYREFPLPSGCRTGTVNSKSKKERIFIATPYDFEHENLELFRLIDPAARQRLVAMILDIAESIITVMQSHSLSIKA